MVDAWFLDGFAPSKNPQMWNDDLFAGLARLARHGASLATFTCAGFVRRGLIAAGFAMQKVKGHGNKREMLAGWRDASRQPAPAMLQPRQAISADQGITLVGGGMASAALALALCRRGRQVTLLCQDPAPAMGASGNRQGALYPLLHAEADNLGQFYASAFGFARRSYEALLTRHTIPHDWCGVLQLAHDENPPANKPVLQPPVSRTACSASCPPRSGKPWLEWSCRAMAMRHCSTILKAAGSAHRH